jgi:isopentenyl-diphosphate delta-isomerase
MAATTMADQAMTSSQITDRKNEHLALAGSADVQMTVSNGLEAIRFEPIALPELDLDEIDTSVRFLGKILSLPLMIASMSGGTLESQKLNEELAVAAQTSGIALGLGSMRIALENPSQRAAFELRSFAPTIPILANIGGAQLRDVDGVKGALKCIEIADADALIVHLNPLQEALQPNGDTRWTGIKEAIARLIKESHVPVVIKEVGHGIGPVTARALADLGVHYIDVAGAGGTSWAAIETQRLGSPEAMKLGTPFHNFGITLAEALVAFDADPQLREKLHVIASGGIRSGLDVAKALRMGAHMASAAVPFLHAARLGDTALTDLIAQWHRQLKICCFVTGSPDIKALKSAPLLGRPR